MGSYPCSKCEKCGSDLAMGPEWHREPEPHMYVDGRCQYCYKLDPLCEVEDGTPY
jgi:hypothetical protein